jgi:hypothetical protein
VRYGIAASRFNREITERLVEGARDFFHAHEIRQRLGIRVADADALGAVDGTAAAHGHDPVAVSGAQPSEAVANLLRKSGIWDTYASEKQAAKREKTAAP